MPLNDAKLSESQTNYWTALPFAANFVETHCGTPPPLVVASSRLGRSRWQGRRRHRRLNVCKQRIHSARHDSVDIKVAIGYKWSNYLNNKLSCRSDQDRDPNVAIALARIQRLLSSFKTNYLVLVIWLPVFCLKIYIYCTFSWKNVDWFGWNFFRTLT